MTENLIKTVKVIKVISECENVKTIIFNLANISKPKPGQFAMIWVPGVDEIPMSISNYNNKGDWSITVKIVGECTKALSKLKAGDYIGVRGPLGNCFQVPKDKTKKLFLIGGGIGIAPLKFFASELKKQRYPFKLIIGAKQEKELISIEQYHDNNDDEFSKTYYCTDDGSYGKSGFTIDLFEDIIKEYTPKDFQNIIVYTCGPEIMMFKIFELCYKNNIEMYTSLERVMRCGCGLCGLCTLDPLGLLVCKDGPIFNSEELIKIKDFGNFKRDFSGKKISFN